MNTRSRWKLLFRLVHSRLGDTTGYIVTLSRGHRIALFPHPFIFATTIELVDAPNAKRSDGHPLVYGKPILFSPYAARVSRHYTRLSRAALERRNATTN